MSVEEGALAELVINCFVTIDIPDARARAFLEVDGHRLLELADATVDPTGDGLLGAFKEFSGFIECSVHD